MAAKSETIHQLKITLDDIAPPIWRRVQVASDISLYKLHGVIQTLFGWSGGHMHQFVVGEHYYGDKSMDSDMKSERTAKLSQIAPAPKSQFLYEYDMGDDWRHIITVDKIIP
ncbi:MAG: plasmid pRiA4b ORF-3-like protein, partial [Capsulimonas sp.]|nr:plasmid pRiA4b ORF-3-like protein [Capsulimonas sp.]